MRAFFFKKRTNFKKKFAVLLQRSLFAGALNRGICPREDRPHCGLVLPSNFGPSIWRSQRLTPSVLKLAQQTKVNAACAEADTTRPGEG
jgi:hypothetical protein